MSIEPESLLTINKIEFTENDIDLIEYKLLPKTKKNVFYSCLIFFLLIPIMPFLPARISHKALIQSVSYEKALVIFCIANGLVMFGIYDMGIVLLNKDINEGHKYRYTTRILRKTWKGNNKFEIELSDRPKNVTGNIILNKDEFYETFIKVIGNLCYTPKLSEIKLS